MPRVCGRLSPPSRRPLASTVTIYINFGGRETVLDGLCRLTAGSVKDFGSLGPPRGRPGWEGRPCERPPFTGYYGFVEGAGFAGGVAGASPAGGADRAIRDRARGAGGAA